MIVPAIFALYGLLLGSFFNVLICRLPDKKSIIFPASHCPSCKAPIRPWHNIPLISYLLLGGKCFSCKQPISVVYPLVELVTALSAFGITHFLAPSDMSTIVPWIVFFVKLTFLLLIIPVTVIDFKHYIIPDEITLPFIVAGLGVSFFPGAETPLQSLLGLLAGGGSLYAIGWIGTLLLKKEAMGGGDVKLMAAAGALFGAQNACIGIVFGALLGSVYGIVVILLKRTNSSNQIPFGPFLGAGLWAAVIAGQQVLDAYLSFIGMGGDR
jgi:leader peptidase (prepilin peptidase)/N-methyltransferase